MMTTSPAWSSLSLTKVLTHSCPAESLEPSCRSAYASSMKSTPPSARLTASEVSCAVSPWCAPIRSLRVTSISWPFLSTPSDLKSRATSRATVVLPVPGLPRKSMCSVRASLTPSSERRRCTTAAFCNERSISLTASSPITRSNSASRSKLACSTASAASSSAATADGSRAFGPPRSSRGARCGGRGRPPAACACSPVPPSAPRARNSASSIGMYRPWPGVHRKYRSPRYLPSQSVVVRFVSSRSPATSRPRAKSAGPR
mmetsp:Transcript_38978/g.116327  ORF Transcript_38978/g.116327 Transcript_38978/m.116327 type:complete len:259 (+) Transcript_38978:1358-2134(+)